MNQDTNLLAKSQARLIPVSNICYRSRIYTSDININPLIAACDPILSLATTLTTLEYPDDRDRFLQDLAHEIRAFEHRAKVSNYQSNIIAAARFALCSLLDEIIASTPWGKNNNWSKNNLLSLFHNENCGDERFFTIIKRSLANISNNLHLIELLYICLNLGFVGKYKKPNDKQSELIAITNKLYQVIGQYNHHNHRNILINGKESEPGHLETSKTETKINRAKLFWITTALTLAISCSIYTGINFKLNSTNKPIHSIIKQITSKRGNI